MSTTREELDEECENKYKKEIETYLLVSRISLGLTAFTVIAGLTLKKKLKANLSLAWKMYYGLAIIKIFLGILLLTVLYPTCPSGCSCTGGTPWLYPMIVLAVGFQWLFRGMFYYKKDQRQNNGNLAVSTSDETEMSTTNSYDAPVYDEGAIV